MIGGAVAAAAVPAPLRAAQWTLIASAPIDFRAEQAVLAPTGIDRVGTLRLQIYALPIFVHSLTLSISDGSQIVLPVRASLPPGGQSAPIAVKLDQAKGAKSRPRRITAIEVSYRSKPAAAQLARLEVWGTR
jgi:hypothetical protein